MRLHPSGLAITLLPGLLLLAAPGLGADEPDHPSDIFRVGGGTVAVEFAPVTLGVTHDQVIHWIKTAATAISHYYGRYPVNRVLINVQSRHGRGSASGTTYGDEDGAYIRMGIGDATSNDDMQADWVMTHEMVHLAFPRLEENQHWAEEGQATYIEPIARAEIGDLSVDYLWLETLEGMPKGLPAADDEGLDHTASWGRTYWGGALFYLLADVQIRERTHNRYGLQDALAAVVAAGGNVETSWAIDKAFTVADKAVGVPVLEELYAQMKDKPVTPDLPALWKKLGVALKDGKVVYDDSAPEAAIRRAITAPGAH
ncbi:MAG TPA: hypothetical protein VGT99_12700 [Gammaproteobacteria bacterium]|nr:hypothetical protein [Gammaproteobacteria bacterium]